MISKELLGKICAQTTGARQNNEEVAARQTSRQALLQEAVSIWKQIDPPLIIGQIIKAASQGSLGVDSERSISEGDPEIEGRDGFYRSRSAIAYGLPLPDGVKPKEHTVGENGGTTERSAEVKISVVVSDRGTAIHVTGGGKNIFSINPKSQTLSEDLNEALGKAWNQRVKEISQSNGPYIW